ncbi:MAG: hypothetical protein JWN90_386 [Parcubacteria group bacterium]|nr:hypothetical protein [Parcubacteria group bacterium]
MSTPNPLLGDTAARLAADRKRDEEVFRMHKEAQEKERKAQRSRAAQDQMRRVKNVLDGKETDLRAIETEAPRLKERIATAKRTLRAGTSSKSAIEERAIRDLQGDIDRLEQSKKDLTRQLEENERSRLRAEDELKRHKRLQEDLNRDEDRDHSAAEEEERAATRRLEDHERQAKTLEAEIRKMETEIATLKRDIQ